MGSEWKSRLMAYRGRILFGIALIGAVLFLFPFEGTNQEVSAENPDYTVAYYTEHMEERIASLCRQLRGMQEVHVLLTLDGGSEYLYAEDQKAASREYVLLSRERGEEALPVKEIYPRIRGVAIVCTDGDDSAVQRKVTELLSAALGIPSSSIRVAGT